MCLTIFAAKCSRGQRPLRPHLLPSCEGSAGPFFCPLSLTAKVMRCRVKAKGFCTSSVASWLWRKAWSPFPAHPTPLPALLTTAYLPCSLTWQTAAGKSGIEGHPVAPFQSLCPRKLPKSSLWAQQPRSYQIRLISGNPRCVYLNIISLHAALSTIPSSVFLIGKDGRKIYPLTPENIQEECSYSSLALCLLFILKMLNLLLCLSSVFLHIT